jgi:hypothetical protein
MARKLATSTPHCSNGTACVAFPALGQPSKLSRSNPGPRCFACEERRVASELHRAAAAKERKNIIINNKNKKNKKKAAAVGGGRLQQANNDNNNNSNNAGGQRPAAPTEDPTTSAPATAARCAKGSCRRLATEWDGEAYVCGEHAKVGRARTVVERRRRTVRTCEEGLRSALASEDERLWRKWARLLREAQGRLADAEEDLEAAESRASSSEHVGQANSCGPAGPGEASPLSRSPSGSGRGRR